MKRWSSGSIKDKAVKPDWEDDPSDSSAGNFQRGFDTAPVKLDATYTTPDQSHAMMEPHALGCLWYRGC